MKITTASVGVMVFAVFIVSGQAGEFSTNRVDFQKLGINGRPARMILVTSLGTTLLFESGAKRLQLKGTGFSGLTPISSAGQTVTAPVLVFANPLDHIPWLYRQLIGLSHPLLYHQFKTLLDEMTMNFEGVLGWPEVRDNILVFDSDQRLIRRVEELPPETAGWLKLRIVPDRCLLLEVPLAGGKTGTIWVDTADRRAVILPPAPWKEWTAHHPQVAVLSRKALGLPLFLTSLHEVQADEIKLGPLTLSDVALEDMSAADQRRLRQETPTAQVTWTLGISALFSLDLVVDGKNGWAYLHPKKPETAHLQAVSGDWSVAENVRVSGDNFFLYAGEYKWTKNDLPGALADFTRALELNPRNADAYSDRGVVREIRGQFAEAVSDYDKVIELRPDFSDWERLYQQAVLWRLVSLPKAESKPEAKTEKPTDAEAALKPVVVYGVQPGWKDNWAKTIGLFLVERIDEKALLTEAKKGDADAADQKAEAEYYIGMMRLSKGDKTGAREWLKKCRSAGMKDDNEYQFAVAELARLDSGASR